MAPEEKNLKKTLIGEVVSDKMDKTIVVKTVRAIEHPQFHKILRKAKKYKVHDEHEVAQLGDIVEIFEGRPMSKEKHMHLSRVIKKQSTDAQ